MIFAYILCTHSHKPQSNEQIISPIPANEIIKDAGHSAEVRTATPSATPTPMTDEQMIKSLPHGDLVWKTYGHESTYGKFDGCKAQGKFNGFGYAQSKFGYQCFDSLKEVATKVSNWFTEKLQIMTVDQALCYYNTGKHLDTCEYAEYSKSLWKFIKKDICTISPVHNVATAQPHSERHVRKKSFAEIVGETQCQKIRWPCLSYQYRDRGQHYERQQRFL